MNQHNPTNPPALAGDILMGAQAIADELGITLARTYYLIARQRIPFFRLGSVLCARRSALIEWIAKQERRNSGG